MPRLLALLALLAFALPTAAQEFTFSISLAERADLVNAPALHSGAVAEHNGLWLFVAGRTNGLHSFGADAFPRQFENGDIVVYDRETDTQWSASLDDLPDAIADPLRTTNMQYHARGDSLIVIGGYGHSEAAGGKITFGTMTVIDVPGIIRAVQRGRTLAPHIRQPLADVDALKVAGGHLVALGSELTLVGGNRFDGEYGGQFTQTYTEAIRGLELDGDALSGVNEITDPELHRRDGNVAPSVLDGGAIGVGIYGGVFHPETNQAYLKPMLLGTTLGLAQEDGFEQHVGHYTSPVLALYSLTRGEMSTVFFGGINAFTWDDTAGDWIAVGNPPFIPFTNDIGVVTRRDGVWGERRLDVRMPEACDSGNRCTTLRGTNAAFFLDPQLERYVDGIVDIDVLPAGATRIGWIVGGIAAGSANFGQTWASERVIEVTLNKMSTSSTSPEAPLAFRLGDPVPNPTRGTARLDVTVDRPQALRAEVFSVTGRRVATLHEGPLAVGLHPLTWNARGTAPGLYLIRVTGEDGASASRQVMLTR